LLLTGIIIVDGMMAFNIVASAVFSRQSLVTCQLIGLIGVFSVFYNAAYHYYLSQLITSVAKVFNPKDLSHIKYHFYAISAGLVFSLLAIIIEDIGQTTYNTCGVSRGSILEFLLINILIFVWPFCLWSARNCYL
jgi:hypothetical protein